MKLTRHKCCTYSGCMLPALTTTLRPLRCSSQCHPPPGSPKGPIPACDPTAVLQTWIALFSEREHPSLHMVTLPRPCGLEHRLDKHAFPR